MALPADLVDSPNTQPELPVPPPSPAQQVAGTVWAVLCDPARQDVIAALASEPGAQRFQALPIVLVPSGEDPPAPREGILGAWPYPNGAGQMGTLLEGLDWCAVIEIASRNTPVDGANRPPLDLIPGGRQAGPGYPELTSEEPSRIVDGPEQWGTRAASMPVVNLSLGPVSIEYPTHPADPINFATLFMSANQLFVMAAGNSGPDPKETMSAWAEMPWVLAVGATADPVGATLAEYSSRGVDGVSDSGPDLVAWGQGAVAPDNPEWVGTSFAAPRVANFALISAQLIAQLAHCAQRIVSGEEAQGVPLIGLGIVDVFGAEPFPGRSRIDVAASPLIELPETAMARAIELIAQAGVGTMDITWSPRNLKRILVAAASPMPNYRPHEVGAGFLGRDQVYSWWSRFSGATLAWLFCPALPAPAILAELSTLALVPMEAIQAAEGIVDATAPHWAWDWEARRLLVRPAAAEPSERPPWATISVKRRAGYDIRLEGRQHGG